MQETIDELQYSNDVLENKVKSLTREMLQQKERYESTTEELENDVQQVYWRFLTFRLSKIWKEKRLNCRNNWMVESWFI